MSKISVIITSYNHKQYLIEAVESVVNQTVKPHEVIIADDHSTDGSVEVIKGYMAKYPRLIKGIFHNNNLGIPKNRNSALVEVTGDYVAILDGDDRFLPNNVERMVGTLETNTKARCVYSNVRLINHNGEPIKIRDNQPQPSGDILFEIALGKFGILRSMIIDYHLLKKVGFLDEMFPKYDGFDLTLRLAKHSHYAYVFEPLVEYRVHPMSDSKSLKAKDHLHDLGGIYKKMMPILSGLPRTKIKEIETAWNKILFTYYSNDAKENNNKFKLFFLPLLALFKGYVSLPNFPIALIMHCNNTIKQYISERK